MGMDSGPKVMCILNNDIIYSYASQKYAPTKPLSKPMLAYC